MADIYQLTFIGQKPLIYTGFFQFGLDGQVPSPRQHLVKQHALDFAFPEKEDIGHFQPRTLGGLYRIRHIIHQHDITVTRPQSRNPTKIHPELLGSMRHRLMAAVKRQCDIMLGVENM